MAKQVWTVRIVQPGDNRADRLAGSVNLPGLWIEQLRYMGVARELKAWDGTDEGTEVIELACPDPRGIDTKVWAEQNATRMQSFGINAQAAPKWGG